MSLKKKVLAISGSTRAESSNGYLIKAIAGIFLDIIDICPFDALTKLPHFNPDDDLENVAESVADFRQQVKDSDGVLICTPEYAMGLPGSLKNALDWTVSSCEFSGKPVLAITASSSGKKAHESLLGTLNVIEARIEGTGLLISFIKTKINHEGIISDEKTLTDLTLAMTDFIKAMNQPTGHPII